MSGTIQDRNGHAITQCAIGQTQSDRAAADNKEIGMHGRNVKRET
jgi:hypothetical protein